MSGRRSRLCRGGLRRWLKRRRCYIGMEVFAAAFIELGYLILDRRKAIDNV